MLLIFTSTNDFLGLVVSLWLMLYLLGRGFPSRVTVRAVVILLTTAVFFLGAFGDFYVHIPNAGLTGDILLAIGLAVWCDLTDLIFLRQDRRGFRPLVAVSYAFALTTTLLLFGARFVSADETGRELWVPRIDFSLP